VREAVSRLLPVASIGDEIVGIRLVMLRPLDGAAVASPPKRASTMLVGSFETWLVLELFGRSTTAWNSITLESLCLAIRHLVFFVPGALIGALIDLPADAAIALSLAKRFREIDIGLPALVSWQWVESRIQQKLGRARTLIERQNRSRLLQSP
jgi:hypothetical protein